MKTHTTINTLLILSGFFAAGCEEYDRTESNRIDWDTKDSTGVINHNFATQEKFYGKDTLQQVIYTVELPHIANIIFYDNKKPFGIMDSARVADWTMYSAENGTPYSRSSGRNTAEGMAILKRGDLIAKQIEDSVEVRTKRANYSAEIKRLKHQLDSLENAKREKYKKFQPERNFLNNYDGKKLN